MEDVRVGEYVLGESSLVVIGMRGAGKTSLGIQASKIWNWPFIDLDHVLEEEQQCSCAQVVAEKGWQGFREIETEILERILREHPKRTVISCGGGVVETEKARQILEKHAPVLHVQRNIEDIIRYLEATAGAGTATKKEEEGEERRPNYGESIRDVWERRKPWFEQVSSHDFYCESENRVGQAFSNYLDALRVAPTPNVLDANTIFTLYEPEKQTSYDGSDAVIFAPGKPTSRTEFLKSLEKLREQTTLPVMLDAEEDLNLARMGIRTCCEMVQVHSTSMGFHEIVQLANSFGGTTKLVVKVCEKVPCEKVPEILRRWGDEISEDKLGCVRFANVHCRDVDDSVRLHCELLNSSRCCVWMESNQVLTEVLSMNLGPRCSSKNVQLVPLANELGVVMQDHYCLFGHPIQASPSPTMHNSGFQYLGLRKKYTLCESTDRKRVLATMKTHRFKGASVTIPHKETVVPMMQSLSHAAKSIGAVNTIILQPDGSLRGDNTDWIGIRNLVSTKVSGPGLVGLVLGAGGTARAACYCIQQMGMKLYVYNRTKEKAEALADRFGGCPVSDLSELDRVDVSVVIGTVPAQAGVTLPEKILKCKPVVLDAAYKPRRTKLLEQASASGCTVFEGIQMLIEQGLAQFELWTGHKAPREEIERDVYNFYQRT